MTGILINWNSDNDRWTPAPFGLVLRVERYGLFLLLDLDKTLMTPAQKNYLWRTCPRWRVELDGVTVEAITTRAGMVIRAGEGVIEIGAMITREAA